MCLPLLSPAIDVQCIIQRIYSRVRRGKILLQDLVAYSEFTLLEYALNRVSKCLVALIGEIEIDPQYRKRCKQNYDKRNNLLYTKFHHC